MDEEYPNFSQFLYYDGEEQVNVELGVENEQVRLENTISPSRHYVPLLSVSSDCLSRVAFYLSVAEANSGSIHDMIRCADLWRLFRTGDKRVAARWASSLENISCEPRTWIIHVLGGTPPIRRFFTRLLSLHVVSTNISAFTDRQLLIATPYLSAYDVSLLPFQLTNLSVTLHGKAVTLSLPQALTSLTLNGVNGDFDTACLPNNITHLALQFGEQPCSNTEGRVITCWPNNLTSLNLVLGTNSRRYQADIQVLVMPVALVQLTYYFYNYKDDMHVRVLEAFSHLTNLTSLESNVLVYSFNNKYGRLLLSHLPTSLTALSSNFFKLSSEWSLLPRGIRHVIQTNSGLFKRISVFNDTDLCREEYNMDDLPPLIESVRLFGIASPVRLRHATHLLLGGKEEWHVIDTPHILATKEMTSLTDLTIDSQVQDLSDFDYCAWQLRSLKIDAKKMHSSTNIIPPTFDRPWAQSLTKLCLVAGIVINSSQIETMPDTIEWLEIHNNRSCPAKTKLPSSLTRLVICSFTISKESKLPTSLTHLCIFNEANVDCDAKKLMTLLPTRLERVYFATPSCSPILTTYHPFTNQLWVTKQRLSNDVEKTKSMIAEHCRERRVVDFMINVCDRAELDGQFFYHYGVLTKSPSKLSEWNGACIDGKHP